MGSAKNFKDRNGMEKNTNCMIPCVGVRIFLYEDHTQFNDISQESMYSEWKISQNFCCKMHINLTEVYLQ
jgi:hypothetical protein